MNQRFRKNGWWLFLLTAWTLLGQSCQVQDVAVTGFGGVRIHRLAGRDLGVDVLMQVRNPNTFSFRITGIDLDVSLNGMYVGRITEAEKTIIPARSEELHTLHLNIEMDSWVSGLTTFIHMIGKRQAELEVNGSFRVRKSLVSKTIPVKERTEVRIIP